MSALEAMIALLDVHYAGTTGHAAALLCEGWADSTGAASQTVDVTPIADYAPGEFFRRELPCLLAVLARIDLKLECVIIDGYVWLDEAGTPGLGAHLFRALEERTPVVGIAKTAFKGSPMAEHVLRPPSKRPLYVTSAGISKTGAAQRVLTMHGSSRIPTLVALADRLSRSASSA